MAERSCGGAKGLVRPVRKIRAHERFALPPELRGRDPDEPAPREITLDQPQRQASPADTGEISARFVSLSLTCQVPGDSTPKSRPSVRGDGSGTTIWRWSAISAAVSGAPSLEGAARGCVAAATAARGTNDSDSSSIRGSGMSAAVMASAHRPSRSATIDAPSGAVHISTLTDG